MDLGISGARERQSWLLATFVDWFLAVCLGFFPSFCSSSGLLQHKNMCRQKKTKKKKHHGPPGIGGQTAVSLWLAASLEVRGQA